MTGNTPTTQKQTLAEQACDRLEEMIVTLQLPPGHIFSEAELSERLRIGRTPIREALQRLAAQKLVATLPRRGMVVSEVNIAEYLALLETRRVLDRLIAIRAAKRALPEQRAALIEIAGRMRTFARDGRIDAFMRLDRQGDETLASACRNHFAAQAAAPLHTHCRRFWYAYQHDGDLAQSAGLHSAVFELVAAADESGAAAATDALLEYLEHFARAVLDL